MSSIFIDNLSIKFRAYHDRSPSLKQYFANLFRGQRSASYSDFWAVKDATLDIRAGDRLGIVGHNGAGKSTLLKALCRVYEPTQGRITVEGRLAPLLEIGAGFHPEFTGRENIYLNGAILGFTREELARIEPEVIDFAEIREFIDTPVKYYSTGMYMRLAFSLATAMQPNILVLDEIFAGGDAAFLEKARARMVSMIDKADIMILVSHDHELVKSLCNRVVWIDHGHIVADGVPEDVVPRYLAGNPNARAIAPPPSRLEDRTTPASNATAAVTLYRLRESAPGRFYLAYIKRIPLFRAAAIRLWGATYPLYLRYIFLPLSRNAMMTWRPLAQSRAYPKFLPEIMLCEPARVQTPTPRTSPPEASAELASASKDYEFPAVTLSTFEAAEIHGGTNLVMLGNAALCHDLYDFPRDYTSEELHGLHIIDPRRQRMRCLTADSRPVHQSVAGAFLDACAPNYAHWLTEVLPRVAAFCSHRGTHDVPLVVDDGLHPNIMDSLRMVAGPEREILTLARGRAMTADTLYLTSVAGYVPFERRNTKLDSHSHGKFNPQALGLMRSRLLDLAAHHDDSENARKIYLRRNSGVRRVTNSDEIEAWLVSRGFEVVEPEKLSFPQQVRLFSQAKVVVGSSGAALANIVFSPPKANIIILIGRHPDTSYGYWQSIACACGNQISYVLGEAIRRIDGIHSDFAIDINQLLPLIESAP